MRTLLSVSVLFLLVGSTPAQDLMLLHPNHERAVAEARFTQLLCGIYEQDDEHQPPQDDPMRGERRVAEPLAPIAVKPETPFLATDLCGVLVLVIGVAGWIALGLAVLVLERKPKAPA